MLDMNKIFEAMKIAKRKGHGTTHDDYHDYCAVDHYDHMSLTVYEKDTMNEVKYEKFYYKDGFRI